MEIDIRILEDSLIDTIKFADGEHGTGPLCEIYKGHTKPYNVQLAGDSWLEDYHVSIGSKEDAQNLIKALRKAIDLGWFD